MSDRTIRSDPQVLLVEQTCLFFVPIFCAYYRLRFGFLTVFRVKIVIPFFSLKKTPTLSGLTNHN